MPGETDLTSMLATLTVSVRPGPYTVVSLDRPVELGDGIEAVLREAEGTTAVDTLAAAERNGWPVDFEAAWLTLDVHSALHAVGLTAAISKALTDRDISCNILAGYYHDHILVPADRVDEAVESIEALGHDLRRVRNRSNP